MPRLLLTFVFLAICLYLGLGQTPPDAQSAVVIAARHGYKSYPSLTTQNEVATFGTQKFGTNRLIAANRRESAPTQRTPFSAPTKTAINTTGDMIAPKFNSGECLAIASNTVVGMPTVHLETCRGTDNQRWLHGTGVSQWQSVLDPTYCLATRGVTAGVGGHLIVLPCADSRALNLLPNRTLSDSYQISGTTYVLDSGVYGYVAPTLQNGWSYQYWRWFQDDLELVNAQGCDIAYPFSASESLLYVQELACDRHSQ